MAEYEVGGERFPTKKAITERVRQILYRYPLGGRLDEDDLAFMSSLLLRHTESTRKIRGGVAAMKVMPATYGTRCFFLVRHDGSETDFSFVNCISGKAPLQDLRQAMRASIQDQSWALRDATFAREPVIQCPVTGTWITSSEAHVDHAPPNTFERLLGRFLLERGLEPDSIALGGDDDGEMECYLVDPALRADWSAWHAARAQLRVVSAKANLSDIRRQQGMGE